MTKNNNIKTISINSKTTKLLNDVIKIAIDFEALTGKQLNITGLVGEILISQKLKLKLVVNDINQSFDAFDKDNKKVQIKARRYKGNDTAMTGPLLDKDFNVSYHYAILVLLNEDYTYLDHFRIDKTQIQKHFKE